MASKRKKVVLTGAAGQIGYACLPRIAAGEMFGPDVDVDLSLLEIPSAMQALEGVAMELDDGAYRALRRVQITSDVNEAMSGADWVLMVGAVPRKQGMERADLLRINAEIFKVQGRAVNDHANEDVRVLVVGNPCNTNALIAYHHAPDVPKHHFYAMTMLDERRARTQLAKKADVHVSEVHNMIIWGNHSATQFPDVFNARINEVPAMDLIQDEAWVENNFIPTIQQRGAAIIKARGSSSAASAANGIITSVAAVFNETAHDADAYSLACVSQGQYGVDEGLVFSYPCRTQNGEVVVVDGVQHAGFAQRKLDATIRELRQERDAVLELGLIA